jgi:hypothetical protein
VKPISNSTIRKLYEEERRGHIKLWADSKLARLRHESNGEFSRYMITKVGNEHILY